MPERQLTKRRRGHAAVTSREQCGDDNCEHDERSGRDERPPACMTPIGESRISTQVTGRDSPCRRHLVKFDACVANVAQTSIRVLLHAATHEIAEANRCRPWQRLPIDLALQDTSDGV